MADEHCEILANMTIKEVRDIMRRTDTCRFKAEAKGALIAPSLVGGGFRLSVSLANGVQPPFSSSYLTFPPFEGF